MPAVSGGSSSSKDCMGHTHRWPGECSADESPQPDTRQLIKKGGDPSHTVICSRVNLFLACAVTDLTVDVQPELSLRLHGECPAAESDQSHPALPAGTSPRCVCCPAVSRMSWPIRPRLSFRSSSAAPYTADKRRQRSLCTLT